MNQSRPLVQHADAVDSGAFTGNLRRASLLPGELAVRPPVSQEIRATAGAGSYPQPSSASIYQMNGSPVLREADRPWWHWPAAIALAGLLAYSLRELA